MSTKRLPGDLSAAEVAEKPSRPKLYVFLGRGNVGKTVTIRWMAERAQNAGRSVVLADIDRNTGTLPAFYEGVLRPDYTDSEGIREWLGLLVQKQIETGANVLLDVGGGDPLMQETAEQLHLATLLERIGIQPVAVHLVGPDKDDLSTLRDMEKSGSFCPRDTIIVFNEGRVDRARPGTAFIPIRSHEIIKGAEARGARIVHMPKLDQMPFISARRLPFFSALEGRFGGGPTVDVFTQNAIMLSVEGWLERMEEAFASVAGMLP
jgi:hypothetical protein